MPPTPCRCGFPNAPAANYCSNCGGLLDDRPLRDAGSDFAQAARVRPGHIVLEGTPWARFSARLLDLQLAAWLYSIPLSWILADLLHDRRNRIWGMLLRGMLVLLAWIPLEGLLLATARQTPGKWLFGIHVNDVRGGPPNIAIAVARSIGVWVKGLGLGIPIISIFTLWNGYATFRHDGRASWDRSLGLKVTQAETSPSCMPLCWALIVFSIIVRRVVHGALGF